MRDAMGGDRNQADRVFALERAEPLLDLCACKTIAAAAGRDFHRDQIAVLRIGAGAGRDRDFPAGLLLLDRREPSAAAGECAENAEHAGLGAVDDLDDAAGVTDRVIGIAGLLQTQ